MIIRKKVVIVLFTMAVIVLPLLPQDIHEAAWNGDFEKVKLLLKENPQLLNAKGPWGWTPMIRAVNSHHADVPEVAYLVKVDGLSIYFNGDYAGDVRKDIDYLSAISDHIDLAFAEGGASVTSYMLGKLKPFVWFPMHERGTEFKLKRYMQEAEETDLKAQVICAENRGDTYFYRKGKIKSSLIH